MFGHVSPLAANGLRGHRPSPDLPVLQQVEQSPRAEEYLTASSQNSAQKFDRNSGGALRIQPL
jgi:hypothetical protein